MTADPTTAGGEDDPVVTGTGRPSEPALVPPGGQTPSPGRVLSFAQQRLWFLHTLDPKSTAYNAQTAWHIDGELDLDHLDTAIDEIIRPTRSPAHHLHRHNGIPVQIIHPPTTHHSTRHDLTHLNPEHHDHRVRDILRAELNHRSTSPPARYYAATSFNSPPPRTCSASPGTTSSSTAGPSACSTPNSTTSTPTSPTAAPPRCRPSPPSTPTSPNANTVTGRATTPNGSSNNSPHASATPHPVCHPPTDRPRPDTEPGGPTAVHHSQLAPGTLATLTALAAQTGSTPFGVLLAAFQLLIHRYTHQNPIVIGTPLTGRTDPDAEKLIGFFVNTLPLAVDINPHHTFRQFLHHSRTVLMHAVTHQDIPFDKLVEHARPTRDRHTPPLIQTVFTTMDGTDPAPLHTATMRPLPIDEGVAKFDLTVQVQVEPDVVRVLFDYACDLYEPATMAELADSYRALVAAVLADPDRPLSTVVAVTDAQRERLAALVAAPVAVPPGDAGCVPRLVAEAAARHPDVTAVVTGRARSPTANSTSGPTTSPTNSCDTAPDPTTPSPSASHPAPPPSPPCSPSSRPAPPTSPSTPPHHPHADTTSSPTPPSPSSSPNTPTTPTHPRRRHPRPGPGTGTGAVAPPTMDIHPEQVAYVIHTSGSTGTPKGVMVPHRALTNLVHWHLDTHPTGPGQRHGQVASLGFDAAIWEIWPALVSGATLHVADPADRLDPAALHDWLIREGVTTTFLPTPIAEAVLRLPTPSTSRLHKIFTGGDASPPGRPRRRRTPCSTSTGPRRPPSPSPSALWVPTASTGPTSDPHRRCPHLPAGRRPANRPARGAGEVCVAGDVRQPRLPEQARADGGAVPARPPRHHTRQPPLPHRRPLPPPHRRHPRIPRPHRRTNRHQRLPHRTRRNRSHPPRTTPHRSRLRHHPRPTHRPTPHRLRHRHQHRHQPPPRHPPPHPAPTPRTPRHPRPPPPPPHPQRQDRPQRPTHPRHHQPGRGAARRPGAAGGAGVGRRARPDAGPRRQLLRLRRALHAGHPDGGPATRALRRAGLGGDRVRGADRGRDGRTPAGRGGAGRGVEPRGGGRTGLRIVRRGRLRVVAGSGVVVRAATPVVPAHPRPEIHRLQHPDRLAHRRRTRPRPPRHRHRRNHPPTRSPPHHLHRTQRHPPTNHPTPHHPPQHPPRPHPPQPATPRPPHPRHPAHRNSTNHSTSPPAHSYAATSSNSPPPPTCSASPGTTSSSTAGPSACSTPNSTTSTPTSPTAAPPHCHPSPPSTPTSPNANTTTGRAPTPNTTSTNSPHASATPHPSATHPPTDPDPTPHPAPPPSTTANYPPTPPPPSPPSPPKPAPPPSASSSPHSNSSSTATPTKTPSSSAPPSPAAPTPTPKNSSASSSTPSPSPSTSTPTTHSANSCTTPAPSSCTPSPTRTSPSTNSSNTPAPPATPTPHPSSKPSSPAGT